MYLLIYVQRGCIATVRPFHTVSAASAHIQPEDMRDIEGDDLSIYKVDRVVRSEDAECVATWRPDVQFAEDGEEIIQFGEWLYFEQEAKP